jgi:GNAT superfamily N-acetyltransferase
VSSPADLVGRRVTVRHRLDDGSATDVVGRVVQADDRGLVVERRDGSTVPVRGDRVVALKVVPDRPVRSRRALDVDVDELVRVTSRGWPAPESEPLGDWELRAAGAFTGRANSVAVVGDPGCGVDAALEAVRSFYAERGLTPRAQVVVGSPWERRFVDAGWVPQEDYRGGAVVQVADLDEPPRADGRVTVATRASDMWLSRYGRVEDPAAARAVLEGPRTVGFAALDDAGTPAAAVGRVAVTGEWAGIAAVETLATHRRRGLADAVVRTCLAWAHAHGATRAYLQTMPDNAPALALYAPHGFVTHHEYRYLVPSQETHSATGREHSTGA